jgi:hypothetical protein
VYHATQVKELRGWACIPAKHPSHHPNPVTTATLAQITCKAFHPAALRRPKHPNPSSPPNTPRREHKLYIPQSYFQCPWKTDSPTAEVKQLHIPRPPESTCMLLASQRARTKFNSIGTFRQLNNKSWTCWCVPSNCTSKESPSKVATLLKRKIAAGSTCNAFLRLQGVVVRSNWEYPLGEYCLQTSHTCTIH